MKKKRRAHFRMAGYPPYNVHVGFFIQATPAIQCARRFFHSYLKETKKIDNQFLNLLFEISLVNQNSHVTHVP